MQTSSSQLLLLDSSIRDWVVLPLLAIMISAGLLRQYLSQYLRAKSTMLPKVEIQSKSLLQRLGRIRCAGGGGGFLDEAKFEARRRYYVELLQVKADEAETQKQQESSNNNNDDTNNTTGLPGMDPSAMLDGMKGGMVGMVQNMVMMQGISHFFKGFVLLKVPFALTNGFKGMFQRGLELTTLDTSYVSSVSWYFLVMYGLRGFFRLVMADNGGSSTDDQQSVEIQAGLGNAIAAPSKPPGQEYDAPKIFRQQADNMEVSMKYYSRIDDAEKRLLGSRYPGIGIKKKMMNVNKRHNPADDIFGFNNGSKEGNAVDNKNQKALRRRRKH